MKYAIDNFEKSCQLLAKMVEGGKRTTTWNSSSIAACKLSQQLASLMERIYKETSASRKIHTAELLEMVANKEYLELSKAMKEFSANDDYQKLWATASKYGVLDKIAHYVDLNTLQNIDAA